MRMGRNGEDPKKKSNGVEPPQKQYTWDDVSKNEAIKERNKAAKKKYESDVANYNIAMKAYTSQPKSRDLKSHFQGGGRYLSPNELEAWNKDIEASGLGKERGGLKATKVYVTKDFGKEGSVSSLKTASGKSYAGGQGTFHEWLGKPEQAKAPVYEKEENIDIRKIPMSKLPLKRPGKIADKTTGPLRMSERVTEEKPDWEAPSRSGSKSKTKFRTAINAVFNPSAGATGVKLRNTKVAQKSTKRTNMGIGDYSREGRMAKAYFGGGFEKMTSSDIIGTKEELGVRGKLKKDKAEFKAGIKEARKAGDREKVAVYRASKQDINTQLKQTKLAGKYLKALGKEYEGVAQGEKLDRTGKISKFTPEKMAGFIGSKQDVFNSDAKFNKAVSKISKKKTSTGREIKNK